MQRSVIALAAILALVPPSALAEAEPGARPLLEQAAFGAFVPGLPYFPKELRKLEKGLLAGGEVEIVSGFVDWEYIFGEPRDFELSHDGKRTLLYSWEPHCTKDAGCIRYRDVVEGRHDAYFLRIVESMRKFPGVIYVRPWAEMNAPWSDWQPGTDKPRAGSIEEFKQAWRYVYDFFRSHQVRNLRFVFNPDAGQDADTVPVEALWPGRSAEDGHDYVDVLGIDGYNWGDGGPSGRSHWREFNEVFAGMYATLTALDPEAPVWICEFGSKEPRKDDGSPTSPAPADAAHDKGKWLEQAFGSTAFPRVEALVYYSSIPSSGYRRDFRIHSSRSALLAARRHLRERTRLRANPPGQQRASQ